MARQDIVEDEDLFDDEQEFDEEDLDDEDEDEDEFEEGFEPANAPAQNAASVAAAGRATKGAKKRPNDKTGGDKTFNKADKGIVRELYNKMNSMKMEDLRKLHATIMDEDFDVDSFSDENDVLENVDYDFSEDLNELVESEATLSEEFKEKTAVIMEAAIKSKLRSEIARLEESYEEQLDEAVTSIQEDLVEKIDSYLTYVVENWLEENKLAVQVGLRTEIAENFMNSLKDLFVESYIDVPEEKVDLVDDLSEQVESLEAELNGMIEKTMTMSEELEMYKREAIILEMADGLADTQIDRLASLAEGVDFDDEESFREKVAVIKETYFGTKKNKAARQMSESFTETDDDEDEEIEVTGNMAAYVTALKKSNK